MAETVCHLQGHGVSGELRYNERGFIRAVCKVHPNCQRQRQVTQGRSAPGRPIGALVHFLRTADAYPDRTQHCCSSIGSHSDRLRSRQWFQSLATASSQEFLALERAKEPNEPEEPWQMR